MTEIPKACETVAADLHSVLCPVSEALCTNNAGALQAHSPLQLDNSNSPVCASRIFMPYNTLMSSNLTRARLAVKRSSNLSRGGLA